MKQRRPLHNAMKMPPRNTTVEIPKGIYGPNSRLNGMDINGQVYQVGQSRHSDVKSYRERFDLIKWDKEEEEDERD